MTEFENLVDYNAFIQEVNLIKKLINNGTIKILIRSQLDFIVNEKLLKDDPSINLKVLEKTLKEVLPIMMAILAKKENYLFLSVNQKENKKEQKESENLIKKKVELVKEALINDEINNRYLIKQTSKESFLGEVYWEINSKILDSKIDGFKPLKYAKVVIYSEKPNNIFPFESIPPIREKAISADVDIVDLENLIDTLKQIKRHLSREVEKYETKST